MVIISSKSILGVLFLTHHYRHLYRLTIVVLNILTLFLFLVDVIHFIVITNFDSFRLMWDCIGFAVTVFLDISQQNVLNQIIHKPVALTIAFLALILAVIVIILSIF